jgi:hypothetical protein
MKKARSGYVSSCTDARIRIRLKSHGSGTLTQGSGMMEFTGQVKNRATILKRKIFKKVYLSSAILINCHSFYF